MSRRISGNFGLLACLGALAVGGSSTAAFAQPAAAAIQDPYPPAARALNLSGHVTLGCTAGADGRVYDCGVASEDPSGWGFGQGALKLAPTLNVGAGDANRPVQVPIAFRLEAAEVSNPQIKAPGFFIPSDQVNWLQKPDANDYGLTYPARAQEYDRPVQVEAACRVAAGGVLTACVVLSAKPDSKDIVEAVAQVASRFRMASTTRGGGPVDNGVVKVTLDWSPN